MTRVTVLKLATGYEATAAAIPGMTETERLSGEFLSKIESRELLAIIEPSFASAHRQVLALAATMNRTAEILKAAIERGSE